MRLPRPFYRLPLRFDAERMRAEVSALPPTAWVEHPNHIAGNTCVRLISVEGGENDEVNGAMRPTKHLAQCPYLRQVLASFGVVWSRSRLLRLAPGAKVPVHADINYHWFNRVRLHVPITTRPEVQFHCGDIGVHMAAGEPWVFDNWRLHWVENPTPDERIHLVADTSGSAAFWRLVAQSESATAPVQEVPFDPSTPEVQPLTERAVLPPVMSPAEVDLLILDLRAELVSPPEPAGSRTRLARYHALLDAFCRDWRQAYALYGTEREGWPAFAALRDDVRRASRELGDGLFVRTNRVAAHTVLEARVLQFMLTSEAEHRTRHPPAGVRASAAADNRLREPVFIIAAPRSGSTLLFETLAVSRQLFTLGDEGHELIEGLPELQPGAPDVDSNRLEARHASPSIAARIRARILERARSRSGAPAPSTGPVRFLEKTPKNALRIPFIDRIFPDARFIVLWRDPRENLSSIIEAWRSGHWKTYNGLPGFDGPWSLLLPPGWRQMNGRPLETIAAFQWDTTYRIVLDDLARVPRHRWTVVTYAQLVGNTRPTVRALCDFTGIEFDAALAQHVSSPLPLSRYTLTAPEPGKWRRNEALVESALPTVLGTWNRLRALPSVPVHDPAARGLDTPAPQQNSSGSGAGRAACQSPNRYP
jgi:hypothetical protein